LAQGAVSDPASVASFVGAASAATMVPTPTNGSRGWYESLTGLLSGLQPGNPATEQARHDEEPVEGIDATEQLEDTCPLARSPSEAAVLLTSALPYEEALDPEPQQSNGSGGEREDLLDQHVAYYMRHHPEAESRHTLVRTGPGQYDLDGRGVTVEWQYGNVPGEQGYLVVLDGPLRQPFSDYMEDTEANVEYDHQHLGRSSLHQIPKEKRISFGDHHKVYSRLEAMKVAKEQALVREKHADYVKEGKQAPEDLMHKYRKTLKQKLGEPRRQSTQPPPVPHPQPQAVPMTTAAGPAPTPPLPPPAAKATQVAQGRTTSNAPRDVPDAAGNVRAPQPGWGAAGGAVRAAGVQQQQRQQQQQQHQQHQQQQQQQQQQLLQEQQHQQRRQKQKKQLQQQQHQDQHRRQQQQQHWEQQQQQIQQMQQQQQQQGTSGCSYSRAAQHPGGEQRPQSTRQLEAQNQTSGSVPQIGAQQQQQQQQGAGFPQQAAELLGAAFWGGAPANQRMPSGALGGLTPPSLFSTANSGVGGAPDFFGTGGTTLDFSGTGGATPDFFGTGASGFFGASGPVQTLAPNPMASYTGNALASRTNMAFASQAANNTDYAPKGGHQTWLF